jgi:RTX calcium-binding nonapeptide repeat (4 copies)
MRPRIRRAGRLGRALALGAGCMVLSAASARAATVSVRPSAQPAALFPPMELVYTAAPGELNRVVIQATGARSPWTLSDTGAEVVPGDGCAAVDAHTASCAAPPFAPDSLTAGLGAAEAALGDGDDELRLTEAAFGAGGQLFADGGPGNDVLAVGSGGGELRGGPGDDRLLAVAATAATLLDGGGGRDELHGGHGSDTMTDGDLDGAAGDAAPGPDEFDGGVSGVDTVSYRQRIAPVFVDLARRGPQGAAGEGDRVRHASNVIGGAGADRLAGDGGANELDGWDGHDRLFGRDNNDSFLNADGPISCGADDDVIVGPVAADYAKRGCETVRSGRDDPGTSSLVYPERIRPSAVRYRVRCPVGDEEFARLWCAGRVTVREATGAHRRLADGHSHRGRWTDRSFGVRLTRLARRLASRRSGVLATVTFGVRTTGARPETLRWTIRLKVPG